MVFFFAADALFKKIKDDIMFLLKNQYKDYTVCITGHSFAGATATLLSVLVKKEFEKNKIKNKIEVFSFGPGPVFYPISKFPSEGIELNTFVNNADLIPRISIKNIFKLLENIDLAEYLITSKAEKVLSKQNSTMVEVIKAKGNKCPVCWKIQEGDCLRHPSSNV